MNFDDLDPQLLHMFDLMPHPEKDEFNTVELSIGHLLYEYAWRDIGSCDGGPLIGAYSLAKWWYDRIRKTAKFPWLIGAMGLVAYLKLKRADDPRLEEAIDLLWPPNEAYDYGRQRIFEGLRGQLIEAMERHSEELFSAGYEY